MLIRTKLQVNAAFVGVVMLIIGGVYYLASQDVENALNKQGVTQEASKWASDMLNLTGDYILHHEARARDQWYSKVDQLQPILASAQLSSKETAASLAKIESERKNAIELFDKIVALYEEKPSVAEVSPATEATSDEAMAEAEAMTVVDNSDSEAQLTEELKRTLTSQVFIRLQLISREVSNLRSVFTKEFEEAQKKMQIVTFALMFVVPLIVLFVSIMISRSITKPIRELVDAGTKIANGDLTVEIPVINTKDEMSEMADTMTLLVGAIKYLKESKK